jgi:prepilin-type N-terminal cleavage/methylation domain-containing protein
MNLRSQRAFTLIELLVVLGISAVLSTVALSYSHVSQNTVAITIEEAKISQLILQAKELSIATYTGSGGPNASCGYGITFDGAAQQYSLFAYAPASSPPCPAVTTISGIALGEQRKYTDSTWHVPVSRGVVLQTQADSLVTALFYPPEPTVFLSHDGATFPLPTASLNVHLMTADGGTTSLISINPEGQVNF